MDRGIDELIISNAFNFLSRFMRNSVIVTFLWLWPILYCLFWQNKQDHFCYISSDIHCTVYGDVWYYLRFWDCNHALVIQEIVEIFRISKCDCGDSCLIAWLLKMQNFKELIDWFFIHWLIDQLINWFISSCVGGNSICINCDICFLKIILPFSSCWINKNIIFLNILVNMLFYIRNLWIYWCLRARTESNFSLQEKSEFYKIAKLLLW